MPIDYAAHLLDALQAFDETTAPLGLYACEEYKAKDTPHPRLYQEWHLCLKPCLETLGCETGRPNDRDLRAGHFWFTGPNETRGQIELVRTSKIKVRKYGSAYRVDPHNKYEERWASLGLGDKVRELCRFANERNAPLPQTPDPYLVLRRRAERARVLLFVGFAAENPPFANELTELEKQCRPQNYGVSQTTRFWEDRYGRRFNVCLAAWSYQDASESASENTPDAE